MNLQSEQYNSRLQQLASLLNDWRDDAENYQQKITEAAQAGKPVAGMETYHAKQIRKIEMIENFAGAAHALINTLNNEISRLRTAHLEKKHQEHTGERIRICDMQPGPNELHLQVMDALNEIIHKINQQNRY